MHVMDPIADKTSVIPKNFAGQNPWRCVAVAGAVSPHQRDAIKTSKERQPSRETRVPSASVEI